jgi:hypothetical protein
MNDIAVIDSDVVLIDGGVVTSDFVKRFQA